MSICPKQAIVMEPDEEGFLYPNINQVLCNECGLCKQVCSFYDGYRISSNFNQPLVYAVKHRDDEVRMNSSSGGMFTAISDLILSNDGIIYGAVFDEQFRAFHQKAENVEERNKLRGSKYVQSDLRGVFKSVKEELKIGRKVLFSGTPCQNAGLHAFLNEKYYDNLYLCDIVCHGTPSPILWKEYIHYLEHMNKSSLTHYSFRYKKIGWRGYNVYSLFNHGKSRLNTSDVLIYVNLFGTDLPLRPSCYSCKFANLQRPSDMTIGDFWGIEKSNPDFEDERGVSLVLVNSPKGQALFEEIKSYLAYHQSSTYECLQYNLEYPTKKPIKREEFWQDYHKNGFDFIAKKYAGYGFIKRIKRVARNVLEIVGLLPIAKKLLLRK